MKRAFSSLFSIKPDYSRRVYGLDVFRAVAILIVVMGHGSFLINGVLPAFPFIRLPDGVELFFVLSGFLIGGMLIKLFDRPEDITASELVHFWKRRWFRTLPNYYLVLLLNAAFVYFGFIGGDIKQFTWKFFFFIHNFSAPFVGFFWESWSLSIEEWFYLLAPVTLLTGIYAFRKETTPKNILLIVICTIIAGSLFYRVWISSENLNAYTYDINIRKIVLTRIDAIMFGVLFAWVHKYHYATWKKYARLSFFTGLLLMYAVILTDHHPNGFFAKTIYFSLLGLSAAMLLPLAEQTSSFKSAFGRIITHVSIVSYSMYLINLGLVAQVIEFHFMPSTPSGYLTWYLAYWIIVIAASTMLYKFFEKPVMDLRDRF